MPWWTSLHTHTNTTDERINTQSESTCQTFCCQSTKMMITLTFKKLRQFFQFHPGLEIYQLSQKLALFHERERKRGQKLQYHTLVQRARERERERERAGWLVGVSGLTWRHRRATWGSLDLGSPGAAAVSAHRRPVLLHRPSSSFFYRSTLLFSVLTWVRLLRWTPACSVANGEASTGSLVADDLPRAAEWIFPVWLVSHWSPSFLRRPLQRPEDSVAASEVSRRRPIADDFSGRRNFIFCVFLLRSGRLKCSWARFVLFSFSGVAGRRFYQVNGPCLLVSLLWLIVWEEVARGLWQSKANPLI